MSETTTKLDAGRSQLKRLEERHKRQHSHARTEALVEGITALETMYRDALAGPHGVALHRDETRVHFRRLNAAEIARYVELDSPLDCAGSFRSEALGATLLERVDNTDPTALIGLPLVWLAGALRRAGLDPLNARS